MAANDLEARVMHMAMTGPSDAVGSSAGSSAIRRLRRTLYVVGGAWAGFFVVALVSTLLDSVEPTSLMGRLTMWGHGGADYVIMICAINIVIGLALLRSASAPVEYRHVIDVCLAINAVHLATMVIAAVARHGELQHLAGDVGLGVVTTVALAAAWLPVRSSLTDRSLAPW